MPHNSFNEISPIATMLAFAAALWGTVINFARRDINKKSFLRIVVIFISDFMVSAGFTMLTYIGLVGYGLNDLLAVSVSGYMGYLGIKSSHLIELILTEKVGANKTFNYIKEREGK